MRNKKRKKFRAVKQVKALARERVGTPKPARLIPDRRAKENKHKKDPLRELD